MSGIEFVSLIAALAILCFGFVTEAVLITHQSFTYSKAMFRVLRSLLYQLLVWGVHQKLVESTTGMDDQSEILYQIILCSSIKNGVKQEEK